MKNLTLGIAGASGSGKSYLTDAICKFLRRDSYVHFDMDGYHFHNRDERNKLNEYPENPTANNFSRLVYDIQQIQNGQNISMPTYNHQTGDFGNPKYIQAKRIIIVEGLHANLINSYAGKNIINFPIFINTEENIRNTWKVSRDVLERTYQYNNVIEQIQKRKDFIEKYIYPQMLNSKIIINIYSNSKNQITYRLLTSNMLINEIKDHLPTIRNSSSVTQYPGYYEMHLNKVQIAKVMENANLRELEENGYSIQKIFISLSKRPETFQYSLGLIVLFMGLISVTLEN